MASKSTSIIMSVTYTSPANESFVLDQPLPLISSASVADRTSYLSALGGAVIAMQERVNKELTARMEQDNAATAAAEATHGSQRKSTPAVNDAKEEENYGEEVQEDDD